MSTTLRWQDVAGQVRGPDYTDSAAMITRGIEGIGQSVSTLGGQGDARRKEMRDQENQVLALQLGFADKNAKKVKEFGEDLRAFNKEEDLKELSAVQSFIQTGARDAALNGVSLPDFLANSKEYASLDEGARSYLGSIVSDSYIRGDDARRAQLERDADNRRAQANADRSYRLQLASHRESVARGRRADAAAAVPKPGAVKVWKTGSDKTDRAMTRLANITGAQYVDAAGLAYDELTVADVGKNHKNLGAVASIFDNVNKQRIARGANPLPQNVLKRVIDGNIGNTDSWTDGFNDVNDSAIEQSFKIAADQYDTAVKGKMYYEYLSANVEGGARPDEAAIDLGWNKLFPKEEAPKKPSAPTAQSQGAPGPSDWYKMRVR